MLKAIRLFSHMVLIVEALTLDFHRLEEVKSIWRDRWQWFHQPLHAMACILHPLWRSETQFRDQELREGWNTYLRMVFPDAAARDALKDDLLVFRGELLEFGSDAAQLRPGMLRPVRWWMKYGDDVPVLQRLAIRILSQVALPNTVSHI